MHLLSTTSLIVAVARAKIASLWISGKAHVPTTLVTTFALVERHSHRRNDIYNILWIVVFGFATLNILTLAGRRFEPNRRGMTYGELMAVLVVLMSVFLLGWELLSVFHIFPIKLQR
jgi:hypothetical protein